MTIRKRTRIAVAVGLLLAAHAAAAVHALSVHAVTVDEVAHLPAGISYWETGSFALYHHNPPLVKLLAALPALALHPVVPGPPGPGVTHFEYGWSFMYANAERYQRIYFAARLVGVGLSLLAGLVLFAWGQALFGTTAGLLALALWSLCPNVLAHSGVVTMDLGLAAAFLVAGWALWRHLRRPSPASAVLWGAALGLALLTKFTALLLLGIWPALAGVQGMLRLRSGAVRGGRRVLDAAGRSAARCALALAALLGVVNAGYGFEGSGRRLDRFAFESADLTRSAPRPGARSTAPERRNRFEASPLGALPVPLPEHFVLGIDATRRHTEGVYRTYLGGEWRRGGWHRYYLVTLLLKVPVGTWLLFGVALAAAATQARFRADATSELVIGGIPAATLAAVSLGTDVNLGLRYVLPVLPFWLLWIARLGRAVEQRARWRWIVPAALLANLLSVARVHPHHLSYFNEPAGGPENGARHLLDSNLDWGQDLLLLDDWLRLHRPGVPVGLAYFGGVDPGILPAQGRGFPFHLAPPGRAADLRLMGAAPDGRLAAWLGTVWDPKRTGRRPLRRELEAALGLPSGPQPGLYAISVNFLYGYAYRVRDAEGNLWYAGPDAFGWLRTLEPVGRAGHSIFLYEVSLEEAKRARASLGLPPLEHAPDA